MRCLGIIFIYACMYHWAPSYIETLSACFERDTVEERIALFSFTSHVQFTSKLHQTAPQHHHGYHLTSSRHHVFSLLLSLLPKWFCLQSVFHTAVRVMFSDIKKWLTAHEIHNRCNRNIDYIRKNLDFMYLNKSKHISKYLKLMFRLMTL